MIVNLKVKTLDSQTYDFAVDNEITVREFKTIIAEKTKISTDLQRIIYCGRVLVDEKQLKEYDVDGKVLHVVERPPPTTRTETSTTSSSRNDQTPEPGRIRDSPIFRALDGVFLGAMSIPIAAGVQGNRQTGPPMTPSSSFCMNRITVARHMLQCVNNIAAYLENPQIGLNNTSLDILSQGRWSTVVDFGISSANVEIPSNHQMADSLQEAISAALRQSAYSNVAVVQLPQTQSSNSTQQQSATTSSASFEDSIPQANANVPISTTTEPSIDNTATGTAGESSNQRTGTRVLAEVIQEMRTVNARMEPFFQQYYDLLLEEPTFDENNTEGVVNAQRLYDRVSEAYHYMSHAQHAISDLMLDMSLPTPRYFCCRPILVEQSGFVTSNHLVPVMQTNVPSNETVNSTNQPSVRVVRQNVPRGLIIPSTTTPPNGTATERNRSTSRLGRLLQLNTRPIELHIQIDDSAIRIQPPNLRRQQAQSSTSTTLGTNENLTSGNSDHGVRASSVTQPTTSTETRSTSRPQVQMGNFSNWNSSRIAGNSLSSFDRFLPCSSHHIQQFNSNNNNANESNTSNTSNLPEAENRPPSSELSAIYNSIRSDLRQIVEHNLSERGLSLSSNNNNSNNVNNTINYVIRILDDALVFLPQYDREDYDTRASVENLLRNSLSSLIYLIIEDNSNDFGVRMNRELSTLYRRLFALLIRCIGRENALLYWNQIFDILPNLFNLPTLFLNLQRNMMNQIGNDLHFDSNLSEIQEYLVIRRPAPEGRATTSEVMQTDKFDDTTVHSKATTSTSSPTNMELDDITSGNSIGDLEIPNSQHINDDPLPTINIGSEAWHNNFPTEWLSIITRDVDRQKHEPIQSSFSDAYISGMSAKRRKLVQNSKLTTGLNGLVLSNVRQAIQATGIKMASEPQDSSEEICRAIAIDPSTQASYREALRSLLEQRLQSDPDYSPDKFPNCSTYFRK